MHESFMLLSSKHPTKFNLKIQFFGWKSFYIYGKICKVLVLVGMLIKNFEFLGTKSVKDYLLHISLMWKFQITQKFVEFLPTFFSCAAGKSRQEFCKFLAYLKFPHQPYKKWSLIDVKI